ncbi:MAG: NHLP leader peptide family RiPP precursor [Bacteroidetes bacterium]|nr:NHLP leader peptide family RiPP precursor [Bacteroidota bacterium]
MEDRKQLERRIVEKAMKDETFRNQLIEKPKETLELETGIKLPSGLNIHILEEKSDEVYTISR